MTLQARLAHIEIHLEEKMAHEQVRLVLAKRGVENQAAGESAADLRKRQETKGKHPLKSGRS